MTDQDLRELLAKADETAAALDATPKEGEAYSLAVADYHRAALDLQRAGIAALPDLLARLEAAEAGWRGIESAPKDGRAVDLWVTRPALNDGGVRVPDAFWHAETGRWLEPSYATDLDDAAIYVDGVGPCDTVETKTCRATHYRLIPSPPSTEAEKGGGE